MKMIGFELLDVFEEEFEGIQSRQPNMFIRLIVQFQSIKKTLSRSHERLGKRFCLIKVSSFHQNYHSQTLDYRLTLVFL